MATTREPKAQPAETAETTEGAGSTPVPAPKPATFVRREPRTAVEGGGFRPPYKILRFEAGPGDPIPDLWIEVRAFWSPAHLTALHSRTYWTDILAMLAPFVTDWNAEGVRLVDRVLPAEGDLPERTVQDTTIEVLDPPAVAGAEAFGAIATDDAVAVWTWVRDCMIRSAFERPDESSADAA